MTDDDVVAPVIWSRMAALGRGRTPAVTHEQIASAAVEIADAEGFGAATMRRIAAQLGVGTMSLYRYVSSRDDVVDLMVDQVLGELTHDAVPGDDRREVLATLARQTRSMVLRHPWMARHSPGTRPSMGPHMIAWIEESTAALDREELTIDQVMDLSGTVTKFVMGYTQAEVAEREAEQRTGITEEQWRARVGPYMMGVLASGEYPYLERIVREAEDFPDRDEVFERQLGYVLDGLAVGPGLD